MALPMRSIKQKTISLFNAHMILAVGTDIIEIQRIKDALERRGELFMKKLLTPAECDYCMRFTPPFPRIAGRFAGKEAIAKALGTGIGQELSWLDIEIINDRSGKPVVCFSEKAEDLLKTLAPKGSVLLSISHCKAFATATALLQDLS